MYGILARGNKNKIIQIPDCYTGKAKEKRIGLLLAGDALNNPVDEAASYFVARTPTHIIYYTGVGKFNKVATYYAGRKIIGSALVCGKIPNKPSADADMMFLNRRINNLTSIKRNSARK